MAGVKGKSGRKPDVIGNFVKQHIQKAFDEDPEALNEIWKQIIIRAKAGSDKHSQLLFNYYYGKPKENLEQPTELIVRISHE